MDKQDTGFLLNPVNIKLHREWFKQMCDTIGLKVIFRAPRKDKHYNNEGELDTFFYEPILTGCIYDEHPNQWTMKKLGWNAELDAGMSVIHVPYDLPNLERGALFILPSALDGAEGRVFRVEKMSTITIYPASIACEIGPVWKNRQEPAQNTYQTEDFNLLIDDDEEN